MRRRTAMWAALTWSMAVCGCRGSAEADESGKADTAARLAEAAKERATAGNNKTIALAEIAPFDWDNVSFFGPYSTRTRIEALLGFPWKDADRFSLAARDDVTLIVFSGAERVTRAIHVRRSDVDLVPLAGSKLARANALLVVRKNSTTGWITLTAADARAARPQ